LPNFNWYAEFYESAGAGLAAQCDVPTHACHQFLDDGHPQPKAFTLVRHPVERVEDTLRLLSRHAGTVVLDRAGQRRTPRFCLRRASYTQADNAIAGVLCGVVQNVGKRRSEAVLKSDFEVV
jgi:hypothetical protein